MPDLKIITMRDVETESVEWLWHPYIPAGKITIVQGDPGDGKTTMMLAVAAAVTNGDALPNGSVGVPASVIFQTAEDEQALSLSDERIEQAIVKMGANGVRPLMKALGAIAERTGCAIVIIGHLNKKGGKSQYRGLGSIDIFAAARSVLTVGRIDVDETMRGVVHNKSNLAPFGSSLAFGLDPVGGFCWLGDYDITIDELFGGKKQQPENQFSKARRLIETALRNGPVLSADMEQMAEEQGVSSKTLYRAKQALGVISAKRGALWYWELPIEADFTDVDENQGSQDSHAPPVTALAILPNGEEV